MIAVDTNVLVRLLVNDPREQAQIDIAKALLHEAKQVYVPQIVQVELVWVLETAYSFEKAEIIYSLHHLAEQPLFDLQHQELFLAALDTFQNCNADFSDCLILAESQHKHCELASFDKKLGKLQGVRRLKK
jgi:predicted nucleic-acid-binding protein